MIIRTILLAGFISCSAGLHAQTARDIHYGKDDKQVLDYWKAADPGSPVLIFIHGGNAWADKAGPFLEAGPEYFSKRGYAAVNINYRHPGNAGYPDAGTWPMPLRDLACAVAYVKRNVGMLNGDPNRVILVGYSAGGYLANVHGHTFHMDIRDPQCLHPQDLSVMAVVSMAAWRIGTEKKTLPPPDRIRFDDMEVLNFVNNKTKPVFFILHGTNDQKVGSVEPYVYYRTLRENKYPARMKILDGKGHAILFNQPGVCREIELFLDDLLEHRPLTPKSFTSDVKFDLNRSGGKLRITLPQKVKEAVTVRFFNGSKLQAGENQMFSGTQKQMLVDIPDELKNSPYFYVSVFSDSVCQILEVGPKP